MPARPLLASLLVLGAACGPRAADPPLANRNAAAPATGVRAIDWRNRAYDLEGLGAIKVVDGSAEFSLDDDGRLSGEGTGGSFRVDPPLFADIDGDGVEDAIVLCVLGTGGTGKFSSVGIYTLRAGKVVEIGDIPGGDRGDGGIRKVALDGTGVIVERNVLAEGDGACCASSWRRERWIWRGGEPVEDTTARGAPQPQ